MVGGIVGVYVTLIIAGRRRLSQVKDSIREDVRQGLIDLGREDLTHD